MRKITLILFALLFCAGCAAPVAPALAPEDAAARFAAMYAQMEPSLAEMTELPPEMALDYYGLEPEDYTASLFRLSADNMLADEVVLLQAKDDDAAARMEKLLQARLEQKAAEAEGYSPEQYAIIKDCKVLRSGQTLCLAVAKDFAALQGIFDKGLA